MFSQKGVLFWDTRYALGFEATQFMPNITYQQA